MNTNKKNNTILFTIFGIVLVIVVGDNWSFYLFVLWFVEKNKRLESKDYGKSKSGQAQP